MKVTTFVSWISSIPQGIGMYLKCRRIKRDIQAALEVWQRIGGFDASTGQLLNFASDYSVNLVRLLDDDGLPTRHVLTDIPLITNPDAKLLALVRQYAPSFSKLSDHELDTIAHWLEYGHNDMIRRSENFVLRHLQSGSRTRRGSTNPARPFSSLRNY